MSRLVLTYRLKLLWIENLVICHFGGNKIWLFETFGDRKLGDLSFWGRKFGDLSFCG